MRCFVLILAILMFSAPVKASDCEMPSKYTNRTLAVEADTLLVSFGTDKYDYSPTDTVHTYLVVQNQGSDTLHLDFYPDLHCIPLTRVYVFSAVCDSPDQPGCDLVYPWGPWWCFCDLSSGPNLAPGECMAAEEFWIIAGSGGAPPDGEYKVLSGVHRPCVNPLDLSGFLIPAGGVYVTIEIDSAELPVNRSSWGNIKALYR
jgi:hypothetical protein